MSSLLLEKSITKCTSSCQPLWKPIQRGRCWCKRKCLVQMPVNWKMGDSCHRPISQGLRGTPNPFPQVNGGLGSQSPSLLLRGDRDFYKEGEGNRTNSSRGVVKKFFTWRAQSIPIRQVMVHCASPWFSHPGLTWSWLYINLAGWLKVNTSLWAGMPEGQSLYLLKLVPRILIQTCYSSTSYMSQSQHLQKQCQKNDGVSYNFPLLQEHHKS